MKRKVFTLVAAIAVVGIIHATNNKSLTIKKATKAITIDGVGDEIFWGAVASNFCGAKKGTTALDANFKMTYDDNNIYILVTATDPTPNQNGSSIWQSDCVDLYFAMDTGNSSVYRSGGDINIRKLCSRSQADGGIDGSSMIGILNGNPDFKVVQKDGSDYIQEWQIPYKNLTSAMGYYGLCFNGKDFRFEIQVTNNDGSGNGRIGQSFWNTSNDNMSKTVKDQGYIVLETPVDSVGTEAESVLTLSSYTLSTGYHSGSSSISINSITDWRISSIEPWLTFSSYYGSGNTPFFDFYFSNNTSSISRVGTITFFAGSIYQTFTVTQAGYNKNNLKINKAIDAITIDGIGNETSWVNTKANFCNEKNGTTALNANFKMTYDNNNIYVLVTATDPTPNQNGSSIWQSDCVDLYFAMDTSNTNSYRQAGDYDIRKLCSKSQADGGIECLTGTLNSDPNFKVVQVNGANYVQEWQIPIAGLTAGMENAGLDFNSKDFRFEIQVSDNNGTGNQRTGQSFWNTNTDYAWNTNTYHGYITMSTRVGSECDIAVAELNEARDSLNMLLGQISETTTITINNVEEYTTVVNLQGVDVQLKMYPNSSLDKVVVECNYQIYQVNILNMEGKQVYSATSNGNSASLQLDSFANGVYMMYVFTEQGLIRGKFTIAK